MTKLSLKQQICSLEAKINQMVRNNAPIEDVSDMRTQLNKLKKRAGIRSCTVDNPIPGHPSYWKSMQAGRITLEFCSKCNKVVESESLRAEIKQMKNDDIQCALRLCKHNYEMADMK
jgi:hypothetical protein